MIRILIAVAGALLAFPSDTPAQGCAGNPVAVQILGSGGPRPDSERASSGYLLWIGDHARVLVDIGGGAFARFGQAQARLADLSLIAISHLHPDHVSDLPALLWLSHEVRSHPLRIVGPSGNFQVPSLPVFLARLFDESKGAFPLLAPAMGGARADHGGSVRLDVRPPVDVTDTRPSKVLEDEGLVVIAKAIPHGNVPTLAYRVETLGVSVVFSSDQTGTDPEFVAFARGARVLVMHLAVGAGTVNHPLHAAPAVVGRVAQAAGIGQLILSHIGRFDLGSAVAELRRFYTGPLIIGADLLCTPVR